MLKQQVRSVIRNYSPSLDTLLRSRGLRKHFKRTFHERQRSSKRKAYGQSTPIIMGGPFSGMLYLDEVVWGPIEPKWFGTYEAELHAIVRQILNTPYQTIVDVGSAEGFYSVGLAFKMPGAKVSSFDIDPWARAQQRRLARLNNVTNISFGKYCTGAHIDALKQGRSLLICDIEGGEYDLLDVRNSASLAGYDILVETHPCEKRGLTGISGAEHLAAHFRLTHQVECLSVAPRSLEIMEQHQELSSFSPGELAECLDEGRDFDQRWLWLRSLQANAKASNTSRVVDMATVKSLASARLGTE